MSNWKSVVVVMVVAMTFAKTAFADERDILRQAIKVEEDRARDSQTEVVTDDNLVKNIAATIPNRLARADEADRRAQAFRNAAIALRRRGKDRMASAFEGLATSEVTFARNDREEAAERTRAKDILAKQANIARANRDNHARHAADLRERLRLLDAEYGAGRD